LWVAILSLISFLNMYSSTVVRIMDWSNKCLKS
jgi:hypothetical protein